MTPTKGSSYIFDAWSPAIEIVTKEAIYTATYKDASAPGGGGEPKPEEGLDAVHSQQQAVKILHNGQIFILRGDRVYTVTGQEVR